MGVRAKCSRCDYLRTFADELRGTYYRCPKCRQGVIAVPTDAQAQDESAEAPAVNAARMPDNRSSEDAARALESGEHDAAKRSSTTDDEASGGPLRGVDETPRGVLRAAHVGGDQPGSSPDAASSPSETGELAPSSPSAVARAAKGQTYKVQRILVECAGCGHHVAVPPQFFGKTVHCPECRADMAFSESSLEPVKDEILGRIALEEAERRTLRSAVPPPIESPEVRRRARRKQILLVSILLVVLLGGIVFVGSRIFSSTPSSGH